MHCFRKWCKTYQATSVNKFQPLFLLQELQAKTEQICEMAAVMAEAIHIDDQAIQQEQERLVSIESENKGLRELLKISGITAPVKEEEASPKQNTPEEDTSSTTTD